MKNIKTRLEYLRKQIENERISYKEIAELESLKEYIDKNDVLLLQWAGVEEQGNDNRCSVCDKLFNNGDIDLLKDNTIICHACKHKNNLELTDDFELVEK